MPCGGAYICSQAAARSSLTADYLHACMHVTSGHAACRLLRGVSGVSVLEKASIDEAFILTPAHINTGTWARIHSPLRMWLMRLARSMH